MQNRSCFTCKQTCNGEYTKHCTRSRHQLKMAAPAEVSEKRSTFRIRQFKEKCLFNIAPNLTLNTMASFVILRIVRTARIACSDRHTYIHTDRHTHETTTVTLSTHARRGLMKALKCKPSAQFAHNYTINVSSKCGNIISHQSLVFEGRHNAIDLRRSARRSPIFESRHIDLRRSTHRSSIFEGRHIDLRRLKAETSHRQPNIAPTTQHRADIPTIRH